MSDNFYEDRYGIPSSDCPVGREIDEFSFNLSDSSDVVELCRELTPHIVRRLGYLAQDCDDIKDLVRMLDVVGNRGLGRVGGDVGVGGDSVMINILQMIDGGTVGLPSGHVVNVSSVSSSPLPLSNCKDMEIYESE